MTGVTSWKLEGAEVGRRERRGRRHIGQDAFERQHGFDSLARSHDCVGRPEADRVAQQVAYRLAWVGDQRLAGTVAPEPGAVNAGDLAGIIRDGGDYRRP